MQELLETLDGWRAEGAGVGRAVVVRTFGCAPRPEGAVLLVTDDGRIAGSVSGGCVEGAAAEEIWARPQDGRERVIRYGISDEQAWDVGLACGGTIDVLSRRAVPDAAVDAARETREGRGDGRAIVTPLPADAPPAVVRRPPARGRRERPPTPLVVHDDGRARGLARRRRRPTRRSSRRRATRLAHGVVADDRGRAAASCSSRRTRSGRGSSSSAPSRSRGSLVRLAKELGYETVVIDGRAAFATEERFPDVDRLVVGWPDELADEIGLGPADAVAVLTHDVKFDEPAIVEALAARLPVRRARSARARPRRDRRARLLEAGVTEAELDRLRGPDRAGPRRAAAGRDGARDHGRDRRGAAMAAPGRPMRELAREPRGGASPTGAAGGVRCVGGRPRRRRARPGSASPKLLAPLDGRPLLQHVLDAVADGGPGRRRRRARHAGADDVEAAIAWRAERRVVNPRPADGLSSSLRVGLASAMADDPRADAVIVAARRPAARSGADVDAGRRRPPPRRRRPPFVRPALRGRRRAEPGPRPRGRLAARRRASTGDRGLGPLLAAHPELVHEVPVDGVEPGRRHPRGPRGSTREPASIVTRDVRRRSADLRRSPRGRLGRSASGPTATRPSGSARRRRRTSTPRSRRCSSPTRGGPASRRSTRCWRWPRPRTSLARHRGRRRPLRAPARPRRARGHRRRAVGRHARRAADGHGGARDRQRPRRRGRVAGRRSTRWATCRPPTSR